ncbi:hypothetical protein I5F10_14770 [Proteus mirabilis]|nr:hypothetical protein [Proteus mirabilis]MBG6049431.1 hypothetical protein [Proteus mirabilis]
MSEKRSGESDRNKHIIKHLPPEPIRPKQCPNDERNKKPVNKDKSDGKNRPRQDTE